MPDASLLTSLFPEEVVTRALLRDVELPYGAGTMALITLDNGRDHTRPSTFGPAGLLALGEALDAVAARTDVAAVGVTGKPFIFAVGADLSGAPLIAARDEALTIARLGHAVFRRLGEVSVPSFAFVDGAPPGGGPGTAPPSAAAWNWRCTARTGRSPPGSPRSRSPSASSACCPAGAAPTFCRT